MMRNSNPFVHRPFTRLASIFSIRIRVSGPSMEKMPQAVRVSGVKVDDGDIVARRCMVYEMIARDVTYVFQVNAPVFLVLLSLQDVEFSVAGRFGMSPEQHK